MFKDVIVLVIGLVLLVVSSDQLVAISARLARLFRLSTLFIGLVLVSFGTSLPEAAVSITAVIKGEKAVALGNVVGSNIINITLILGLAGLFGTLRVRSSLFRRELPYLAVSTLALLLFSLNGVISRLEGLFFIVLCLLFLRTAYGGAVVEEEAEEFSVGGVLGRIESKGVMFFLFVLVAAVLIYAANLMVDSGVAIAGYFGVKPWVIAMTIFAIGTSLPELAATVAASIRKMHAISIGNVVGSNIFNITFIIGLVALIKPITVDPGINRFEMPVLAGITGLAYWFMYTGEQIDRRESIVLCLVYLVFVTILLMR